ncbi:MAG: glycosyltransferase [Alishewanella agri]|nr:glycosyltransferase [Alishewanella agri]
MSASIKVSVVLITYNSSGTVIETLNSIKNQDIGAGNVELVISDDCSTDSTVEIVEQWLKINGHIFSKVLFIKCNVNGGVSANCNVAWKAASCNWIKTIAGDDILLPSCLSDNINYVNKNPECKIVFSKMQWFGAVSKITPFKYDLKFFEKDASNQNFWLKFFSFNIAPTSFINREALQSIGYADVRFRSIEDLPLWIKFTSAGYHLQFIDKVTVKYRVGNSISKSVSKIANVALISDLILLNKSTALPFVRNPLHEIYRLEQLFSYKYTLFLVYIFGNRKGFASNLLTSVGWIFRPVRFFHGLKRRLVELFL